MRVVDEVKRRVRLTNQDFRLESLHKQKEKCCEGHGFSAGIPPKIGVLSRSLVYIAR
jgi:hypothetical protein